MTTLPPGMFPPPTPQFGPQPSYGQHLPPGRGAGGVSGGGGTGETPFSDVFDFSFGSYATPSLVKLAYGALVALAAIGYVLAVIITFAVTATTWDFGALGKIDGSPIPGVLVLALGWIVPFLLILLARVSLEQALAVVHTAQDVRAMRERADLWLRGARP